MMFLRRDILYFNRTRVAYSLSSGEACSRLPHLLPFAGKNPQWEKCLRHVLASNTHYFSQSPTRLPARQLISPIIQFLGKKGHPPPDIITK